jgi:hypothetical protein
MSFIFMVFVLVLIMFSVFLIWSPLAAFALQQVAGQIELELSPGQTSEFRWGLLSDGDRNTEVYLRAEGAGSEFLSLPSSVILEPSQYYWIDVLVSVPQNHSGGIQLKPSLFAKELGDETGTTVMNIQMQKIVTINISPNPDASLAKSVLLRDFPHTIRIGDEQFEVLVQSSADVDEFSFDKDRKELSFRIIEQAPSGTTAVHVASLLNGPHTIAVDDTELTGQQFVSSQDGSLQIEHSQGTHYFSIIGTSVVPEFSFHVLIVASILAIITTARALNRSSSHY